MVNKYLEKLASIGKGTVIGATVGAAGGLFTGKKNNSTKDKIKRVLGGTTIGGLVGGLGGKVLTKKTPIESTGKFHTIEIKLPNVSTTKFTYGKKLPDGSHIHKVVSESQLEKAFQEAIKVPGKHNFHGAARGQTMYRSMDIKDMAGMTKELKNKEIKRLRKILG
jgi:hypothetical protein